MFLRIVTLAWLNFTSDDDAKKFFPKMTTKWDDQEYAEYFADQDAYLFDYIGNPQIASTSRATLRLRLPFVDEDGELSVCGPAAASPSRSTAGSARSRRQRGRGKTNDRAAASRRARRPR